MPYTESYAAVQVTNTYQQSHPKLVPSTKKTCLFRKKRKEKEQMTRVLTNPFLQTHIMEPNVSSITHMGPQNRTSDLETIYIVCVCV